MNELDEFELEDQALVASLEGRTVIKAEWIAAKPEADSGGQEEIVLTLDDNRRIRFSGWGSDIWGVTIEDLDVLSTC